MRIIPSDPYRSGAFYFLLLSFSKRGSFILFSPSDPLSFGARLFLFLRLLSFQVKFCSFLRCVLFFSFFVLVFKQYRVLLFLIPSDSSPLGAFCIKPCSFFFLSNSILSLCLPLVLVGFFLSSFFFNMHKMVDPRWRPAQIQSR